MNILGLDLSLTSTGWYLKRAVDDTGLIVTDGYVGPERLVYLEDEFTRLLGQYPEIDVAMVEGYSFGSVSRAHATGEWGGIARLILRRHGIKTMIVPPQTLKKFVVGKAGKGVQKEDMKLWLYKRWNLEFVSNDQCDACCLAMMGWAFFQRPQYEARYGALIVPQEQALLGMEQYYEGVPQQIIRTRSRGKM